MRDSFPENRKKAEPFVSQDKKFESINLETDPPPASSFFRPRSEAELSEIDQTKRRK